MQFIRLGAENNKSWTSKQYIVVCAQKPTTVTFVLSSDVEIARTTATFSQSFYLPSPS